MTRLTRLGRATGRLLTPLLAVSVAACGARDEGPAFDDIALPTFSPDRVAAEAPVEVRRLLAGTHPWTFGVMSPSPDGRYLLDHDWTQSDGWVSTVELATGEESLIPGPIPGGFVDGGVTFSPDGARAAFGWFGETGYEVRSVGVDGSDPEVHLQYEGWGHFPWVADWSSDGRYLLLNDHPDGADARIATLDLATNELRILETLNARGPGNSYFSPDGRFVAYDMRPDPEVKEFDVRLTSLEGGVTTTLVQTPDHERLLGWFPDGSGILFHRSADDSRAIWKLPLEEGLPAGPPELVKNDVWNIAGIGFSDTDYFYGVTVSQPQVHTFSVDLATGRMLEAVKPVVELSHEGTMGGAWAPDGRRLAYLARDAEEVRIRIQSLTGELLRELPLGIDPIHFGFLAWAPSGLLLHGTDASGRTGLHRISPETGEIEWVTEAHFRGVTLSEDGSALYIDEQEGRERIIYEHDLATGERSVRFVVPAPFGDAWPTDEDWDYRFPESNWMSPDGRYVAQGMIVEGDRYLRLVDARTGDVRRTTTPFLRLRARGLRWSPDSRYVLVSAHDDEREWVYRWSVEDGSVLKLVEYGGGGATGFQVSPDGRHVAMVFGERRSEIWRMSFNQGG